VACAQGRDDLCHTFFALNRLNQDAGRLGRDGKLERLAIAERNLVKKVASFPGEVAESADRRAPHRIVGYALELAREFTAFYEECRVVGAQPEPVESFRVALSVLAQRTIAGALGLPGASAPAPI